MERTLVLMGDNRPLLDSDVGGSAGVCSEGGWLRLGYWSVCAAAAHQYARRVGYEFRYAHYVGPVRSPKGVDRHIAWAKVAAIAHALKQDPALDAVLWLDSDVLVQASAPRFEELVASARARPGRAPPLVAPLVFLSNAPYDGQACTGIVYARRAALGLLRTLWEYAGRFDTEFPWEQGALAAALPPQPILEVPQFVRVRDDGAAEPPPPSQPFAHVTHLVPRRAAVVEQLYAAAQWAPNVPRHLLRALQDGAAAELCVADAAATAFAAAAAAAPPPSVRLFVIVGSAARRVAMQRQLRELGVTLPVTMVAAATPQNSRGYLEPYNLDNNDVPPYRRPLLRCCARSHAMALAAAARSDADYAVVLEDDVALRHGFTAAVAELAARWAEVCAPGGTEVVSLGYLPRDALIEATTPPGATAALPRYVPLRGHPTALLRLPPSSDQSRHVWGSQAYMLPRAAAAKAAGVLYQPTEGAMRAAVEAHVGPGVNATPLIDWLLPLLLQRDVAHPPLVVEYNTTSTIGVRGSNGERWEPYLRAIGVPRDEYWETA